MTTVAIHQPNYMPWLGYFRKLHQADVFVFYDNVQMPMGKSRVSRNQVKATDGPRWLTMSVVRSSTPGLIKDATCADLAWQRKHLRSIRNWYAGSPWLDPVCDLLTYAYTSGASSVADINIAIITGICELAGITGTRFVRASQMRHGLTGAESLLPILTELDARRYLTGDGAGTRRYLDTDEFSARGIKTEFVSPEFPPYPQRHGDFVAGLAAIDALLNIGPEAMLGLIEA